MPRRKRSARWRRCPQLERFPASGAPVAVTAAAPAPAAPAAQSAQPSLPAPGAAASANAFNPAISAILDGTYARLSQDPSQYRIQGFIPGGDEVGPGARSFNLGESEITSSANVDHRFSGRLTVAFDAKNEVGVEEAYVSANGLANGFNAAAGRMLSGVGHPDS